MRERKPSHREVRLGPPPTHSRPMASTHPVQASSPSRKRPPAHAGRPTHWLVYKLFGSALKSPPPSQRPLELAPDLPPSLSSLGVSVCLSDSVSLTLFPVGGVGPTLTKPMVPKVDPAGVAQRHMPTVHPVASTRATGSRGWAGSPEQRPGLGHDLPFPLFPRTPGTALLPLRMRGQSDGLSPILEGPLHPPPLSQGGKPRTLHAPQGGFKPALGAVGGGHQVTLGDP